MRLYIFGQLMPGHLIKWSGSQDKSKQCLDHNMIRAWIKMSSFESTLQVLTSQYGTTKTLAGMLDRCMSKLRQGFGEVRRNSILSCLRCGDCVAKVWRAFREGACILVKCLCMRRGN